MFRVFEALKSVTEVIKPIGFAKLVPEEESERNALLFPKPQGFLNGIPFERKNFEEYVQELKNFFTKNPFLWCDSYESLP